MARRKSLSVFRGSSVKPVSAVRASAEDALRLTAFSAAARPFESASFAGRKAGKYEDTPPSFPTKKMRLFPSGHHTSPFAPEATTAPHQFSGKRMILLFASYNLYLEYSCCSCQSSPPSSVSTSTIRGAHKSTLRAFIRTVPYRRSDVCFTYPISGWGANKSVCKRRMWKSLA